MEEVYRKLMKDFQASLDDFLWQSLGLDPAPPEPGPQNRITYKRMLWDMLALGRSYVEVVRDGKEGIVFYAVDQDEIYFVPHQDPKPPSDNYVFEYIPSSHRFRSEEPSVDVFESNLAVQADFRPDGTTHINTDILNTSVAYIQAGDPTWPNQPDEGASSTPSTPSESPTVNRHLRRHPGGLTPHPNPYRKKRWTPS